MRVLQLNIDYSGTGADRCARELYEELPKLGVETAMWVSGRNPGTPPEVREVQFRWEKYLTPLEAFPDLTAPSPPCDLFRQNNLILYTSTTFTAAGCPSVLFENSRNDSHAFGRSTTSGRPHVDSLMI
jgi:hypothetical protein